MKLSILQNPIILIKTAANTFSYSYRSIKKSISHLKDTLVLAIRKMFGSNVYLKGTYYFTHRNSKGEILAERVIHNLVTNAGFAEVAALIGTDTTSGGTAFDYIALGTGSTAANATDTALETEIATNGGSRATGTGTLVTTAVTDDTFQLVKVFSFSGALAITESGVLNAGAAGTLLSRQVFSVVNVANGDSLTVTWKCQVT